MVSSSCVHIVAALRRLLGAVSSQFAYDAEPDDRVLLTGEEPGTEHLEDVEHWIAVYAELITGARRPQGTGPESEERLEVELGRLRDRLAFWLRRRSELLPAR